MAASTPATPVTAGAQPAAPVAHTAAPGIPFKRDAGAGASSVGSAGVGVLVISLVAIVAVLVVRKRLGLGQPRAGATKLLKVLETQRLGPRALLSVVEFSGTHYLIAQGEQGISCVASKAVDGQP